MEAVAIAASLIQVADAGIRLADAIHAYAESVRSYDEKLAQTASDIRTTATLVAHVGSLFQDAEFSKGAGENEKRTANECVTRCEYAYKKADKYMSKAKRSKYLFPLREKKLDLLNARLDKLKNDLHLMLTIIKNKSEIKAALDRKGHWERRDINLLKEIEALRHAQQASDKRYQASQIEHSKLSASESSGNSREPDNPEKVDEKNVISSDKGVSLEGTCATPEPTLTVSSAQAPETTAVNNPIPLQRARVKNAGTTHISLNDDLPVRPTILKPVAKISEENTRFSMQDLRHLNLHISTLLDHIEFLQLNIQDHSETLLSIDDTAAVLRSYSHVNNCIQDALGRFNRTNEDYPHPTSTVKCGHGWYKESNRLAQSSLRKNEDVVPPGDWIRIAAAGAMAAAAGAAVVPSSAQHRRAQRRRGTYDFSESDDDDFPKSSTSRSGAMAVAFDMDPQIDIEAVERLLKEYTTVVG